MTTEPSPSFCVLPWMHVAMQPSGHLQPCCISKHTASVTLADAGGLASHWNSDSMREIRRQMMAGERPSTCVKCFEQEDRGGASTRTQSNVEFAEYIPSSIANTAEDGSAPVRPVSWDFRPGNLCNLRCRMCGPFASTMWLDEAPLLYGAPESTFDQFRNMDWFKQIPQDILDHLPNAEKFAFAGGEPLLSPAHTDLLQMLVDMKSAGDITLTYNTNGTVVPQRVLDLWTHFKSVRCKISVDATGDLNRYIRYPIQWHMLDKNIRKFGEHARLSQGRVTVILHATFLALNAPRLTDLLEYALDIPGVQSMISMSTLRDPSYYRVGVLPLPVRETAAKTIIAWLDRKGMRQHYKHVDVAVSYMLAAKEDPELFREFLRITKILDESRKGHGLLDVLPELTEFV